MPGRVRLMILFLPAVLCILLLSSVASGQSYSPEAKKYQSWLAKRPYISKINVEGNSYFSDSHIRSRLFSRQRSFWQFLKSGSRDRVLRYSVYRDTLEVKYLYVRAGFLNIKVAEKVDIAPKDSSAVITVTVVEGEQFRIASTQLLASDTLPFYSDLVKVTAQLKPGDPVDPFAVKAAVFDLKTIYANHGYPYASVTDAIDSSAGPSGAVIDLRTTTGPPVYFGDVVIRDLRFYSPYLARREMAFKKGDQYSREKIIESQRRLYTTGLFNSISLEIAPRDTNGVQGPKQADTMPDFVFGAIERRPHFISVNTGASQDSLQDLTWDFTAAWGKRNIFVSRKIEFSLQYRFIVFTQWRLLYHRYQIKYTEPRFLTFRMPLTLTGRFEPGVRSTVQPYRIQTWSIALSTRNEWSEKLYAIISGRYENVNIYGIAPQNLSEFRYEEGISVRRKLDVTLVRDTRRDKFVPRSGSFTTYFAQYVGGILGGDDSFYKLEFSWARYQHMVGQAIYATRLKAGWVKEFGKSHEVPSTDRFYLGGANSIRGFKENSIGPRSESGVNVGANVYGIFNQEIRTPLFWKFWGTVFTDMGNGWGSFSQVDLESVLFSYGAGIQFLSPAGPIRLDYAHRLENGIYREDDRWHFTILYAF